MRSLPVSYANVGLLVVAGKRLLPQLNPVRWTRAKLLEATAMDLSESIPAYDSGFPCKDLPHKRRARQRKSQPSHSWLLPLFMEFHTSV